MSFCDTAMVAAKSAVAAPTMAMIVPASVATCKHGRGPNHEEHARRHHGRRVNERRHGCRTFHRVGQPHIQRQLRALARTHRRTGTAQWPWPCVVGQLVRALLDAEVVERSRRLNVKNIADHEAPVTDTIGDKGLLSGHGRGVAGVPEADEEVRAHPDALPPEEGDEQVAPEHEHQHREHEEVQVEEELRELLVAVHVANGVQMDQGADTGDEQRHRDGQRIGEKAEAHLQAPARNPLEQRLNDLALLAARGR